MAQLIRHALSGAGAITLHGVVNQTQEKQEVITPFHLVEINKVGGNYKKRGGGTSAPRGQGNTEFDYIRRPPGVYPLTQAGMEGFGNLAEGSFNAGGHGYKMNLELDLVDAIGIVDREVHMDTHFARPDHTQYVDKTSITLNERMMDQAQEYNRLRIKDLLQKGFTEEEIGAKLMKEREKAIDKAEKMPFSQTALMEAQISKMLPTQLTEDYIATSAASGGIIAKRDMSAYERSVGGGSAVNKRKKYEAINTELRLSRQLNRAEAQNIHIELDTPRSVIPSVLREVSEDRASRIERSNAAVSQQEIMASSRNAQHEALLKLTGRAASSAADPRAISEYAEPPTPESASDVEPQQQSDVVRQIMTKTKKEKKREYDRQRYLKRKAAEKKSE
jgi:hypothetical protein